MTMRKQTNILKPYKNTITKLNYNSCQICSSQFQRIMNQQQQCRRCGRSVCEKCLAARMKIFLSDQSSHINRCCKLCKKQQQTIDGIIKDGKLVFRQSSKFSDQWMKKLNKEKIAFQQIINEYEEMKFNTTSNTIKLKSESKRIFQQLFKSYNYSMRHFVAKLTSQLNNQSIKQSIINVLIATYAFLKDMPYIKELIYFIVYLLCFCSEYQCYFIASRFILKVYPQYIRLENMNKDNLLSHELKMIIDMYKLLAGPIKREELNYLAYYLENNFTSYIKSFTVNMVNITCSFYIVDEMLKNGSYIYLYKSISSLIFCSREMIREQADSGVIQNNLLKNITHQNVKNTIITFERANVKFEMEHQFFDSAEHRKLHEKHKLLEVMYQKSQQKYKNLQSKYKAVFRQNQQNIKNLTQASKKLLSVQEELLSVADKIILLEETQKIKQQNKILTSRNSFLVQESSMLKKNYEELQKKYNLQQSKFIVFNKFQQDYEREIVQLKTKNQVYQIQKLANDISFNTSFIQERIAEKNKKIAELEKINKKYQAELQFYIKNRPTNNGYTQNSSFLKNDSPFNANISAITRNGFQNSRKNSSNDGGSLNFTGLNITTKQEKDSFKKYLQISKEIIEKLKKQLNESQSNRIQNEKQIKKLKQQVSFQKIQLQLNEQINHFINQIPEQLNYSGSIHDLQAIILKETNLHKKSQLQGVLTNFRKCVYEVRYRSIDAKLKQNKIKQSSRFASSISMNNSTNNLELKPVQNDNKVHEQLAQAGIQWVGNMQAVSKADQSIIKREECVIM